MPASAVAAEERSREAKSRLDLTASLRGHSGVVWCVAWSPRGLLASSGADRTVRVWHAAERSSEPPPAGGDADDTPRAGASSATWQCIATMGGDAFLRTVRAVAWGVDGRTLAAACFDATATVLELMGGAEPRLEAAVSLEGHESEVKSLAFSSSGGLLATCSRDRSVWVWEVGLDFDYECVAVLNGHSADVKCVRWHPSAEILLSGGYDNEIRVWVEDEDDWFCLEQLTAHDATVWALAFDKTGQRFVSVGDNGAMVVWQRKDAPSSVIGAHPRFCVVSHKTKLHDGPIISVDWSHSSDLIATGGDDDSLRIWRRDDRSAASKNGQGDEGSDGDDEQRMDTDSAPRKPGVADHDASDLRTVTDENWVEDVVIERAHSGCINAVAWNPDTAGMLATAGDDGLIRIWKHCT